MPDVRPGFTGKSLDEVLRLPALAQAEYEAIRGDEMNALFSCASGRELVERGYGSDVEVAAEANSSTAVPVLEGSAFRRSG